MSGQHFTDKRIRDIQVSPPQAANNCLVTVTDSNGSNPIQYLLSAESGVDSFVTLLLHALSIAAPVEYWTTGYIDPKIQLGYISSVKLTAIDYGDGRT